MERLVQADQEELTAQMRAMVDQTLAKVMDAVNALKIGHVRHPKVHKTNIMTDSVNTARS